MSIMIQCFVHHHHAIEHDDFTFIRKLDQGALGMSDPCGTLQLALKPNSVPRINTLLSNFYIFVNSFVVPGPMVGLEGPMGSW